MVLDGGLFFGTKSLKIEGFYRLPAVSRRLDSKLVELNVWSAEVSNFGVTFLFINLNDFWAIG